MGSARSTRSLVPVKVGGLGPNVAALAAGDSHTCAVKEDGAVVCWGDNHARQLGAEAVASSAVPLDVSARLPAAAVGLRAHASATCALTASGAVSCCREAAFGGRPRSPCYDI